MLWPDVKLAIPHTNVTPLFPSECVRLTQHLKFRPESIGPEACTLGTFRTTNLDPIKASERYRENCNDNEDRREERSVCKIMLPPHVQCNAGHECSLNMPPACLCVPLQGRICFVVSKQPSDSRLVTRLTWTKSNNSLAPPSLPRVASPHRHGPCPRHPRKKLDSSASSEVISLTNTCHWDPTDSRRGVAPGLGCPRNASSLVRYSTRCFRGRPSSRESSRWPKENHNFEFGTHVTVDVPRAPVRTQEPMIPHNRRTFSNNRCSPGHANLQNPYTLQ